MSTERILVIGANGQIGKVLFPALQELWGKGNVIAADIRPVFDGEGIFEVLDATDPKAISVLLSRHKITQLYHLAAILSAKAEENPLSSWEINTRTLLNVLETGRECKVSKLFIPSSIAVFGPSAPRTKVPQNTYLDPSTAYGISKVATETWIAYYRRKYNLDVRSIRYPGVLGYQSMPGGGTTDYAVDIFYKAVKGEQYTCFLEKDTRLPMIYMDDAIRATLELMQASPENLSVDMAYNVQSLSFTPEELGTAIRKYIPDFQITYIPDFRQTIAHSWPESIDDSVAQKDWGWQPKFGLDEVVRDMLEHLSNHS
ncbi:NAD-dependent epimerase/dehydratase family protein [Desertivirga brevis]|uniref:NAD-dependent epimerase/dehydratase family protein n=1 Tax=Desertivirga brevis TaxID=2810310 RepID=UPI001A975D01|nr:NAD-dependent epimerase/dehydratase family protein [Pedobacter sp. SYSU D00873]